VSAVKIVTQINSLKIWLVYVSVHRVPISATDVKV